MQTTEPPTASPSHTPAPTEIPISSLAASARVVTLVDELPAATGGVTTDAAGNLYVADIGQIPSRRGNTVYRITPEGGFEVYAQGEALLGASGNAFDSLGNLFQANFSGREVSRITPDGQITSVGRASGPVGIAIDADGNLFVAECTGQSILRITPDGESSTIAQGSPLNCPNGITIDDKGNLYIANFGNGWVVRMGPDGQLARLAELPGGNNGHLVFLDGRLFVVDRGSHQIYVVSLDGEVALLAGSGERGWEDGSALEASFSLPNGIAASPDGSALYVNQVRRDIGALNYPSSVRVILLGGE